MKQTLLFRQWGLSYLKAAVRDWHGRFVLMGLCMGLVYLQTWLPALVGRLQHGSAGLPLIGAALALGLKQIWTNRQKIAQLEASEPDQVIGHLLILCSVAAFPLCRFAVWPQAILWLLILAGITVSSWGIQFFTCYPLPTLLFVITAYPKPGLFARILWEALTPPLFLEQIMAQAGAAALSAVGRPAVAKGILVFLPPNGAVEVGWGCNGFNMAFTMAAAGLIMGLFYQQRWHTTLAIMAMGIVLALIFNVPRIMLLAIAAVYWGKESFNFWHGTWGGQIFSSILLTVFHYTVMTLIKRRPTKQI
ncbi:cyanoexosortase C [Pseudanabaena sp. FACHB-2040]|uniref:cyanoexosortase C n=1 Tax=Pseudanabaena sp. FACHB-2040 TaxID=2692859 RepID=UPI001682EA31|nr:cyanoexosortase C [Pseudanabaena sp. FACHB-2040]MBD2260585.1 cyanoexosortase C [Pseudanabaena sp. FACHB-2040]